MAFYTKAGRDLVGCFGAQVVEVYGKFLDVWMRRTAGFSSRLASERPSSSNFHRCPLRFPSAF